MRFFLVSLILLLHASLASAGVIQLGEQDFMDGDMPGLEEFTDASAGEDAPFDGFRASDPGGTSFSADFTFELGSGSVSSAILTLGFYDHDSAAAGSQVASFTLGGFDLTALLDAQLEMRGGGQIEYNVYSIVIPFEAFAQLENGRATFSLMLQPPGLGGIGGSDPTELLPGNGAGLDFARLQIDVPEPAGLTLLALASLPLVAGARRMRGRRSSGAGLIRF